MIEKTSILEVSQFSLAYRVGNQWAEALHAIDLKIAPREVHGLVGESGSGKSTLALAVMGYRARGARVIGGEIRFEGEDLASKPESFLRELWGNVISFIPQDPMAALNPSYPIGEQIAEVYRRQGQSARVADEQAMDILARVHIPEPRVYAKRYPHQLSGGMQQRVTIAMALAARPRLLILDEPTTALDVTTEAVILDLIRDLVADMGTAALYVSHNLGVIAQLCDRATVLYAGEVMASGTVEQIYSAVPHPYPAALLASLPPLQAGSQTRLPAIDGHAPALTARSSGCVFADRCPVAVAQCHTRKPSLETVRAGLQVKCHRWLEIAQGVITLDFMPAAPEIRQATSAPKPILAVQSLHKQFGNTGWLSRWFGRPPTSAVINTSLSLNSGMTLGLVGESGSGKTTLARCIVGLETADQGEMQLLDMPLSPHLSQRPDALRRELQMIFQNPADTLNPYRTIGAALDRTLLRLQPGIGQKERQTRIRELLAAVRLPPETARRYPGELSGGEKQRVAIARAFAANPAFVVADEPTSALDVSVQAVILNLLKDLRARQETAYLFISHDLRAVSSIADQIAVMLLGQIVEQGRTEQVFSAPSHPYTEVLVSAIPPLTPGAKSNRLRLDHDLSSGTPTGGCRFHGRCPRKIGVLCEQEAPPWQKVADDHFIRCHIPPAELAALQQKDAQA